MRRNLFATPLATAVLVVSFGSLAAADPPDLLHNYRFITSRSSVDVMGGFAGVDWKLAIEGRFGLVTGYNDGISPTASLPRLTPFAKFEDVRAILFNPLSAAPLPLPGWDLDKTLNLSALDGTFRLGEPSHLVFRGVDGQGQPLKLAAVRSGPLIYIEGANDPGCCDFFSYKFRAIAHTAPYSDFNLDGRVDRADVDTLLANFGLTSGASFEQGDADGDGDIDGDDVLAWQMSLGPAVNVSALSAAADSQLAVPEPATAALMAIALVAGCALPRRRG